MLILKTNWVAGGLLVLAGLFQWTPLKQRCLAGCRTPIGFLATEWRAGPEGALVMGLRHGAYCLGCCWAIMTLLFVFGVMNLLAIIGIATLVAVEKLLPHGDKLSKIGGIMLVGWGLLLIAA
jgi:predicted metal-binding membrane protein